MLLPQVEAGSMPEPTNSFAVRCRGLTKDFGAGQTRVKILKGIDLVFLMVNKRSSLDRAVVGRRLWSQ